MCTLLPGLPGGGQSLCPGYAAARLHLGSGGGLQFKPRVSTPIPNEVSMLIAGVALTFILLGVKTSSSSRSLVPVRARVSLSR